jgi:hypothetical protein
VRSGPTRPSPRPGGAGRLAGHRGRHPGGDGGHRPAAGSRCGRCWRRQATASGSFRLTPPRSSGSERPWRTPESRWIRWPPVWLGSRAGAMLAALVGGERDPRCWPSWPGQVAGQAPPAASGAAGRFGDHHACWCAWPCAPVPTAAVADGVELGGQPASVTIPALTAGLPGSRRAPLVAPVACCWARGPPWRRPARASPVPQPHPPESPTLPRSAPKFRRPSSVGLPAREPLVDRLLWPYRSGRSRQSTPLHTRNNLPFRTWR